jgi:hypothetical protein
MHTLKKRNTLIILGALFMLLPFFAKAQLTPRGIQKDVQSILNKPSIAIFEKGELEMGSLIAFNGEGAAIVVLYDNIAPWAAPLVAFKLDDFSKIEPFHAILKEQNLGLTKSFELDDMNNGFILEALDPAIMPDYVEAARLLSEIDYVLKVHLKAAK